MWDRKRKVLINTEGKFKLFLLQPIYAEIGCSDNAYLRDTLTGENCGTKAYLCEYRYNEDGSIRDEITYEENHYEVVTIEEEEETINE